MSSISKRLRMVVIHCFYSPSVSPRYARYFVVAVVVGQTVHLSVTLFIKQLPFIGQSSFFLQLHDGVDLGFFLLT